MNPHDATSHDPLAGIPRAESWSLLAGQVGQGTVLFCLVALLLSALGFGLAGKFPRLEGVAKALFYTASALIFVPFGVLLTLFLRDQLQYQYVFNHGDFGTPIMFKVGGVWSAQEGSILLWAVVTATFGLLTLPRAGTLTRGYGATYAIALAALCGILAYESPFKLLSDVVRGSEVLIPPQGRGMTPALQNYWIIFHTPTIFIGFGALTIFLAYGVAAMLHGDAKGWLAPARPWALFTLAILGLGICMGGMWAYETQGWGGFWAWDPVENVSLVPWILLVVLTHGIIVQNAGGRWAQSNLWLAGLPYIAFLYGTFLTRSGLLDNVSVHSFASMDKNALVVLRTFLVAASIAYVGLCVWKAKAVAARTYPNPVVHEGLHRESAYRFGMLLLALLGIVISVGMSWPVITALRGGQGARVEEWLYHQVVVWFFVPLMLLMAVTPFISWRAMGRAVLWNRIANILSISIGLTGFLFIGIMDQPWGVRNQMTETLRSPFGGTWPVVPVVAALMFLCLFTAVAALWRTIELAGKMKLSVGGFVAHAGFALLLGGLILSRGFEKKTRTFVQAGSPATALDYSVAFRKLEGKDLFDRDGQAVFELTGMGRQPFEMRPGMYYYEQGEELKTQVWPAIRSMPDHDVYLALFPPVTDVWEAPQPFRVGETRTIDNIKVTYERPTMTGTPGTTGATFGGVFRIESRGETYTVNPSLALTEQGPQPSMTRAGNEFFVLVGRMDAKDKSVDLRLMFQRPIYPIELFYKPFTSLIWVGTGILTLGGLMAAVARRRRRVPASVTDSGDIEVIEPREPGPNLHAPFPAPQS